MGKGKNQKRVGQKQEAYGDKEQGVQDDARNADTSFLKSQIPTAGGGMSPYAAANYGADVENVNRVYGNLRQGAYKALGATGFGNGPSGREASMRNSLNEGEASQLTNAYRTGLNNTYNEGMAATGALENRQAMYNPNASYGGATNSYAASDAARAAQINGIVGDVMGVASLGMGAAGLAKGGMNKMPGMPNGGALPTSFPGLNSAAANAGYSLPQGGGFNRYASTGPARYGNI